MDAKRLAPLVGLLLAMWLLISTQQRARMVRRHRVESFDAELRDLQSEERRMTSAVAAAVDMRTTALASRAALLTTITQLSVELQELIDQQHAFNNELGGIYLQMKNATRIEQDLQRRANLSCAVHGQIVSSKMQASRDAVMAQQRLLDDKAEAIDKALATRALKHGKATTAAPKAVILDDDAFAEAAESTAAVSPPPPTTSTAPNARRRKHRTGKAANSTHPPLS